MRAQCPFELRSARVEPWHGTDQNSTVYTAIQKARTALGYEITNITNISIKLGLSYYHQVRVHNIA